MEMDSSPARKEEVEMDLSGERGELPKKETVGGADAMVSVELSFYLCAGFKLTD